MADSRQSFQLDFFPSKVRSLYRAATMDPTHNLLIERSLDTPDWSLDQLWQVAAWHHGRNQGDRALGYYRRLMDWTGDGSPEQGEILQAIGHVFLLSGKFSDARGIFNQAWRLYPDPQLLFLLAECELRLGNRPAGLSLLDRFVHLSQEAGSAEVLAYLHLVRHLDHSGQAEAARELLALAATKLGSWGFAYQAETYLPMLPIAPLPVACLPDSSRAETFFGRELEEEYLSRQLWRSHPDRATLEAAIAPLSRHVQALNLSIQPKARPQGGQRISLVGDFLRPEVEPYLEAIIALSRRFSVTLIAIGELPPLLRQEEWLRVVQSDERPLHLFNLIRTQSPDLLIYTSLGSGSAACSALASLRLAPVQVNLGSFPVSSGLGSLDYFLSFDWLEREAADEDYSEKLIRLTGTPLQTLNPPDRFLEREAFKLAEDRRYYLCPVSSTQLHADYVPVLARLLSEDPAAQLLMPGHMPQIDALFLQIFEARYPDLKAKIKLLPEMNRQQLLSLCREVDLILDPLFVGLNYGLWTLLPIGTPILTWASPQARGRMTAALYRRLGLETSIVAELDDYVPRAIALAQDRETRAAFRQALAAALPKLCDFVAYRDSLLDFVTGCLAAQA